MASETVKSGGSSSYSTSIRDMASRAVSMSTAATAAISSPTYRTLSMQKTVSSYRAGLTPNRTGPASFAVTTSLTPGSLRALDVSIFRIRAWAIGLCRRAPKSMFGMERSAA